MQAAVDHLREEVWIVSNPLAFLRCIVKPPLQQKSLETESHVP